MLVTSNADSIDYSTFKEEWKAKGEKTLYDRIKDLPEQTLERAWNDMPEKSQFYIVLGCEGGRQKFAVDPNGDVSCPRNRIHSIQGKDTDRLLWEGNRIWYRFGFPYVPPLGKGVGGFNVKPSERYVEEGYLPIIHAKWMDGVVSYEQVAYATLLEGDILSDEKTEGDDTVILMSAITLANTGDKPRDAHLSLSTNDDNGDETLQFRDGFICATGYESDRLRCFLDIAGKGAVTSNDGAIGYNITLSPNEHHTVYVKIPFITLMEADEYALLEQIDYEHEKPRVVQFWKDRVSAGAQITTPNEWLNNFYRAHLIHMLITDDREPGADRYMARVGSLGYGVFSNEACMLISDLDRRGYREEAEKRLETFIHYQSSVSLPGNFSSQEGVFYGAGGYEAGGYNQHHGWVLWGLGEHYWYNRDTEWLQRVAPNIVAGCDWIIRERQSTMRHDANGNKVLEYGFMPAGSLEDVTEYWYWLSTNAYSYLGLKNAAAVLLDAGHPDGQRLADEAEAFKSDLLAGFMEAMVRSPVVRLRDGTYVPHIPPRLYRRGRGFGWLREVLEGAVHLPRCELLESWDDASTWIIKDYEDNLYISERYGYTVPDFEQYWFSRGGFSMQPNLLCHPIPYLWRDEIKHYLRGYFNAFAVAFYPDTCMLTEHPLPTMADWRGDHYKTSDESQSTYWLRLMMIHECGDELSLFVATPREWLRDGQSVTTSNAETYFGPMSCAIQSHAATDEIRMTVEPPRRNPPSAIHARFRHPEERPIKRVTVNGKKWTDFDVEKEFVHLGKLEGTTEIIAYY